MRNETNISHMTHESDKSQMIVVPARVTNYIMLQTT